MSAQTKDGEIDPAAPVARDANGSPIEGPDQSRDWQLADPATRAQVWARAEEGAGGDAPVDSHQRS